jgi:hypothetical protein
VRQHISQMGVLNDYVRYLPTLKDSPKAVPTTKKENIPFGKADLARIVLASVPMSWQNQYNLNHSMVLKSSHTLLPDLEARERVMVEKQGAKLKAKGCLGARLVESLRRVVVRSFASIARPTAVLTRPTSPWTAVAITAMESPSRQQQGSPLSPRSPTRSLGTMRAWPSCRPCSRLM